MKISLIALKRKMILNGCWSLIRKELVLKILLEKRAKGIKMPHDILKSIKKLSMKRGAKNPISSLKSSRRWFKTQTWAMRMTANCFKSLESAPGILMTSRSRRSTFKGRSIRLALSSSANGWRRDSVNLLIAILIMGSSSKLRSFSKWFRPAHSSSRQDHTKFLHSWGPVWPTATTSHLSMSWTHLSQSKTWFQSLARMLMRQPGRFSLLPPKSIKLTGFWKMR